MAETPSDTIPIESRTPEDWHNEYEKSIKEADCLRQQGYTIPEQPSEQAFIDSFMQADDSGNVPWSGWNYLPTLPQDEYYRLQSTCAET